MIRKTIIAGNWKMYKTISEAIELATKLKRGLYELEESVIDIVICPPFTALSEVAEVIADSNIRLGAQDAFWENEGAYTGEVSCRMLKDVGCSFVIVGHSERRQFFGETDETVNKKIKAALKEGLVPIMCIGETLEERERNETFKVLAHQLKEGLKGIDGNQMLKITIAYEPVWAIGTGRTATPQQAQEAHHFIRNEVKGVYGGEVADLVRIQYGGSVKPDNIAELIKQPDIDGALVGGASLKAEAFSEIVKQSYRVNS